MCIAHGGQDSDTARATLSKVAYRRAGRRKRSARVPASRCMSALSVVGLAPCGKPLLNGTLGILSDCW